MPKPIQIVTLSDVLANDNNLSKPLKQSNEKLKNSDKKNDDDFLKKSTQKIQKTTIKKSNKDHSKPQLTTEFEQLSDEFKTIAKTTELQSPYDNYDKQIRYMRWLAFYYLSKKELSKSQLTKKLLDKGCQRDDVERLIVEFADKDYQSDERCRAMLIRENIRKGRGILHIKQAFKKAQLTFNQDELDKILAELGQSAFDDTVLDNQTDDELNDKNSRLTNADWLKLARDARIKKYGQALPKDHKEKARQLRFLQYRGFELGVCLDALKSNGDV